MFMVNGNSYSWGILNWNMPPHGTVAIVPSVNKPVCHFSPMHVLPTCASPIRRTLASVFFLSYEYIFRNSHWKIIGWKQDRWHCFLVQLLHWVPGAGALSPGNDMIAKSKVCGCRLITWNLHSPPEILPHQHYCWLKFISICKNYLTKLQFDLQYVSCMGECVWRVTTFPIYSYVPVFLKELEYFRLLLKINWNWAQFSNYYGYSSHINIIAKRSAKIRIIKNFQLRRRMRKYCMLSYCTWSIWTLGDIFVKVHVKASCYKITLCYRN